MKNLFLFLILLVTLVMFNCAEPDIIENYYTTIASNIPEGAEVVQVWPVINAANSVTKSVTKDDNFEDGIMYLDNSIIGDGLTHVLDVNSLVNNKPSQVYFIVEWVDGCQDETFNVYFRPNGYAVQYATASCHYGQDGTMASTITNVNGEIEWYHDYTWNYNHDGVEKWQQVVIYAVFYTNGVIIN